MGSSVSAYHDDCEHWDWIKGQAKITDVKWDVYSAEARHAEIGWRDHSLEGVGLKFYVKQALEREALARQQAAEAEEYKTYQRLKKKYDK